jgi:hypothetical protein
MHSGRAPCFSEPRPALLVAWADLRATCAYPVQGCRPVTKLYTFRFRQNSSAAFFSQARFSPRLSRLPISNKRGTQRVRDERACRRPCAERTFSEGLGRGT